MTKKCTKCDQEKDISKYPTDKRHVDGLCSWCKQCYKDYKLVYYNQVQKPQLTALKYNNIVDELNELSKKDIEFLCHILKICQVHFKD